MTNWKDVLTELFTTYDFSKFKLDFPEGVQAQYGNVQINRVIYKDVNAKYPGYFDKAGELASCLIYLRTHTLDELLTILECPVCHKYNHRAGRLTRGRQDKHMYCSNECRYSKEAAVLNMKSYKEKTGYDNPYSNPEVWEKRRKNFKEKYGVNTPMELEEFKQKQREVDRQNHGGVLFVQTKEGIDQIQQNMKDHYDGKHFFQTEEARKALKDYCQERYGTDYPVQAKEVRDRQLELFGGIGFGVPEFKAKAEKTFGGVMNSSNPIIRDKIEKTCLERYGKTRKNVFIENCQKALKEKYGDKIGFANEEISKKLQKVMLEKYGVPFYCMTDDYKKNSRQIISKTNLKFAEEFEFQGVKVELDKIKFERYSYDLFLTGTNILLEVDPTITHNNNICFYTGEKPTRDENYHLSKTLVANKNKFECIHVFDWDNHDSIISNFVNKKSLNIEECTIKEVTDEEAKRFISRFSLFEQYKPIKFNYGLFKGSDLIYLMVFNYNTEYKCYELLNYCSSDSFIVEGAYKSLYNKFIESVRPKKIICFCNHSKSKGTLLKDLGMTFKLHTPIRLHKTVGNLHVTEDMMKYNEELKELYMPLFETTENSFEFGFFDVYDCGDLLFEQTF